MRRKLSVLGGALFACCVFVLIAVVQKVGRVEVPSTQATEELVAFVAPEIPEERDEPEPPREEREPTPALERKTPLLSLDQLDIALRPSTGGSLVGDFAMPVIGTSPTDLGTEDFVDFADLDRVPQPIGVSRLDFPRSLRKHKVAGTIVLLIRLDEDGEVLDVQVQSSELPQFDHFVRDAVRGWRFTPPTQQGRPVRASARLPIPIRIS